MAELSRSAVFKFRRKPLRRSRPRSVAIVAWLSVLQALGTLVVGLALTLAAGTILGGVAWPFPSVPMGDAIVSFEKGLTLLFLAFPVLWVSFGLFRLKPWAWTAAMTLQGITQVVALVNFFRGQANFVSMIVSIVIVLYLNQQEVREAFHPAPLDVIAKISRGEVR